MFPKYMLFVLGPVAVIVGSIVAAAIAINYPLLTIPVIISVAFIVPYVFMRSFAAMSRNIEGEEKSGSSRFLLDHMGDEMIH